MILKNTNSLISIISVLHGLFTQDLWTKKYIYYLHVRFPNSIGSCYNNDNAGVFLFTSLLILPRVISLDSYILKCTQWRDGAAAVRGRGVWVWSTCLFCSRYWAFWIWSCVPVMVIMRSSEPSSGSSILMDAPDSWRICLILWPPLPMMEPAN